MKALIFLSCVQLFCWSNTAVGDQRITVKLDSETGKLFIVENDEQSKPGKTIAWGFFKNSINETGWASLEVDTAADVSDSYQAYAAGITEGLLTRKLIGMHWTNVIGDYCRGQRDYCEKMDKFLKINFEFITSQVNKLRYTEPYWHQVGLLLEQLAGLQDGYLNKSSAPHMDVPTFGLNLFQIMGDVEDLATILNVTTKFRKMFGSGSCSALVKVLPNSEDLFVSQDTWNDFTSMLRILKQYNFHFHTLANSSSDLIPGNSASFSSYPGTLQSGDDFYVLSSGLVTLETTIGNGNIDLYRNIRPDNIVLEWIRSIVANRLANTGKEWADVFSLLNSGTYNNQWMIVDYKLFEPKQPLKDGLLTVLEQLPTVIEYADATNVLRDQDYWPSYNTPYFELIFNLSGQPEMVKKFGDWFTYERTPRALIFKRDQKKVKNIETMTKLMRYNNYKNDPLSSCKCDPPYSAENAIAARCDLNPKNGSYPFGALGHRSHGATDMKLTTNKLRKSLKFIAIGGPPHDDVPAFQWSTSDFAHMSHVGQPDKWVFDPVIAPSGEKCSTI